MGFGRSVPLEEKISSLDNYHLTDKGYLLFTLLHIVDDIDADAFVFNDERADDPAPAEPSAEFASSPEVAALAGDAVLGLTGSVATAPLQPPENVIEHIDFDDVLFEPETYEHVL